MTAPSLPEFILARVAEREAAAKAAAKEQSHADGDGMHWHGGEDRDVYEGESNSYVACGPWGSELGVTGIHIAMHDPARVLRQCEAIRRIVEEHGDDEWCNVCYDYKPMDAPCLTLRALGSFWSDHPDYPA